LRHCESLWVTIFNVNVQWTGDWKGSFGALSVVRSLTRIYFLHSTKSSLSEILGIRQPHLRISSLSFFINFILFNAST
jgi:hypothetical protein